MRSHQKMRRSSMYDVAMKKTALMPCCFKIGMARSWLSRYPSSNVTSAGFLGSTPPRRKAMGPRRLLARSHRHTLGSARRSALGTNGSRLFDSIGGSGGQAEDPRDDA